jgi:hypothetical protein
MAKEKERQFMTESVHSKFTHPASSPVNLKCVDEYVTPCSLEGVHGRFKGTYWIKDILSLLLAFCSLLGFNPEDGRNPFLGNRGEFLLISTVSHPRCHSSQSQLWKSELPLYRIKSISEV